MKPLKVEKISNQYARSGQWVSAAFKFLKLFLVCDYFNGAASYTMEPAVGAQIGNTIINPDLNFTVIAHF